jgi:hypothetical protein
MKNTTTSEYNVFNSVVLEKMIFGTLKIFFDNMTHAMNFAKVTFAFQLLDVYVIFQLPISDAKRDFSFMNSIKTRSRYKLQASRLEISVRIKFYLTD